MKAKKDYPIGSISSGTMREADLIPDFVWELTRLAKEHNRKDHLALCNEIQKNIDANYEYFKTDEAGYDLESLFVALDEYAAPYFYFGAHPGDGSDYGFWPSESLEYDFDGLRVNDTSDVPKSYIGEVLHVNDHGNMTLYYKARNHGLKEVWSII